MAGRARALLQLACVVLLCSTVFGAYVTDKQTQLARNALDKEGRACKDIEPIKIEADERANIKDDLVDASGIYDALMTAMRKSNSSDELATNFGDEVGAKSGGLVPKASPLIAFFLFSPIYFCICCWACCPCCKFCLCCRKERKFSFVAKAIFVFVLGVFIAGMVLAGFLSLRGFGSMNEGFKATSCTSAELVSSIMNGQESLNFDGMIKTLQRFDKLKLTLTDKNCASIPPAQRTAALNPDCFLHVLKSQLDDTKAIDRAVVVATETLGLLVTMMSSESGNLEPTDNGVRLYHYCFLCSQLSDPLQKARDALQGSVSQALRDARKSVQDQLQGSALTSLRDSFDTAAKPLTGMTDLIQSSLGPLVEEDSMKKISEPMDTQGALASVVLILFGLLIAACGGTSITAWMCLEKRKSAKLRRLTHQCACCTWNSGCVYILFAFLIGGLLMIVTMIMSSLCLFMEDMVVTPSVLDDVSRALDVDLGGKNSSQMTMLKDILGQCFQQNNRNPLLLEILKVTNSSGVEVSMNQMIVGNTKDQINAQFDKIGSSTSPPKIADDKNMKDLINLLRNTTVSKTMIPKWAEPACLVTQPPTSCVVNTPSGTPVQAGLRSIDPELKDYLVSNADGDDGPAMGSQSIKGLKGFVNAMDAAAGRSSNNAFGSALSPPPPWRDAVKHWKNWRPCDPLKSDYQGCDAATYIMELKDKLISKTLYKCTYFGSSPATRCNVTASSTRCTQETGPTGQKTYTMPKYTVDCNLNDFTAQFEHLATVLNTSITDLDNTTASVMTGISVGMKTVVNSFVLDRITKVSTGLTCGVFGEKYWKFLDGMCYRGVWGMRAMATAYSATAGLTFGVVILIYVVWRISLDNSVLGNNEVEKYGNNEGEVMVK